MLYHEPSGSRTTLPRTPARRVALVFVLMIAVICGAVVAGSLWTAGAKADRERAVHSHQVTATTTGPAKDPPVATRFGSKPQAVAPAVWEQPEHVRRSGTINVPPQTPQGRALTIWVDDAGAPTRPPGDVADRAFTSLSGGTAVASLVGATGTAVVFLVRRRTEGHRLAAWEREWEQVEPVWSGRLRRGSGAGDGDD
ncbi:Rv1733c family protein [Streptomyces gardneri]|uniref:Rv1733c family protein n=1 Tax=Streptomyces gardneri TaxID=66892 RepID=UPI0037D05A32